MQILENRDSCWPDQWPSESLTHVHGFTSVRNSLDLPA